MLIAVALVFHGLVWCEPLMQGQATAWVSAKDNAVSIGEAGIQYIPEMVLQKQTANSLLFDAVASLNLYGYSQFTREKFLNDSLSLEAYRLNARVASGLWETRIGLQQINFGPAKIFRPLQWFDRINPYDPLKLTHGVYGALARYGFMNNANIWTWGLLGNSEAKGFETYGTKKWRPEAGARAQIPIPKGEIALSFHQRSLDADDWYAKTGHILSDGLENRLGFDGTWDLGVAIWTEVSANRISLSEKENLWQEYSTLGCDYTFNNGVHVLTEHFLSFSGEEAFGTVSNANATAVLLDYRFSILDAVNTIISFDWAGKRSLLYAGWQRTLDSWQEEP